MFLTIVARRLEITGRAVDLLAAAANLKPRTTAEVQAQGISCISPGTTPFFIKKWNFELLYNHLVVLKDRLCLWNETGAQFLQMQLL